jgi:hypothetical protein
MKKILHRTIGLGFLALVAVAATAGSNGCYNPNIVNGGLHCSEGGMCPDGFFCHPSGRCYRPDSGPTDCGGSTALCADPPPSGQACNVICQTGCGCGQRCNAAGAASRCVAIGTKTLGQVCMQTNDHELGFDDCAQGLVCLAEAKECAAVNRCYKLCNDDDQCNQPDSDVLCNIPVVPQMMSVPSMFTVCNVPRQDCDPIGKTGCAGSLACFFLNTGKTLCDCPSNSMGLAPDKAGIEGAACTLYSDCKAGLTCITMSVNGAPATSVCRTVCNPSKAACPSGMSCKPMGAKYGFCSP